MLALKIPFVDAISCKKNIRVKIDAQTNPNKRSCLYLISQEYLLKATSKIAIFSFGKNPKPKIPVKDKAGLDNSKRIKKIKPLLLRFNIFSLGLLYTYIYNKRISSIKFVIIVLF